MIKWFTLLNITTYTVGWFWAIFLGSYSYTFIAFAGVLLMIFVSLGFERRHHLESYVQDVILALAAIVFGFILEILFITTGVLTYKSGFWIFPPLWIITLYPLFSLLINHSLSFIQNRPFITFCFGFFGAPFSYFWGASLGGVTFSYSWLTTFVLIGLGWGSLLLILITVAKSIKISADKTFKSMNEPSVKLLYDEECPLCHKEICYLKKRTKEDKVQFIDISSKDYDKALHESISYETAMKQMHAITQDKQILIGIPAFKEVYARCNMPILATLLGIKGVEVFLTPFYKLFAKYRLKITGRKSDT